MSEMLFNEDGSIRIPDNIKDEIPNFGFNRNKKENKENKKKLDIWDEPEFDNQKHKYPGQPSHNQT